MEYEEVQNNEVEALKAIYATDFEELENVSVWNRRPSPKFSIRLRPSTEYEDSSIEVYLQTTMTQTYPKTLPQIEVSKSQSLSGRQLEILKQLIDRTIKSLKGSEMIFEVTSNVQNQIDEWARYVAEAAPNLEEDRLRRLRQEEDKQKEQQDQLQKEREAAAHREEQKYDSLVLEELKRSEATKATDTVGADLDAMIVVPESTPGITTFERPIHIPHNFGSRPAVFRQVLDGLTVQQRYFGVSYLSKVLLPQTSASGRNDRNDSKDTIGNQADIAVMMTKIGLSSAYWRTAGGARLLHELNSELDLIRQVNLSGIVPLSEFTIERFKGQNNEWVITLVSPYMHSMTMDDMINSVDTINFKTTQSWSFQILESLELLHKAGLRHNMLCPDTVLISVDSGTGERSILLRHPQYFHTLMHLNEVHPFEENRYSYDWLEELKQWIPPEGRGTQGNDVGPSSKWDIWQFGALLTLMLAGKRELYNFRGDPESYVRSMARIWPKEISSFLLAVLNPDPSKRPSALELLTDQFFRTDLEGYQREPEFVERAHKFSAHSSIRSPANSFVGPGLDSAAATDLKTTGGGIGLLKGDGAASSGSLAAPSTNASSALGRRRLSNNEEVTMSRYKQDFDEGILLGRGGFGQVVKARNKLDGRIYAVKKVKATSKTLSHILQEVVLLSRLNHQYVVRYYTVWLEDESGQLEDESKTENYTTSHPPAPHDSLSRRLAPSMSIPQPSSDILESITSSSVSMSQFSPHHSISAMDIPSVSHDFMSDSGFVEFGFSDSEDASNTGTLAFASNEASNNGRDLSTKSNDSEAESDESSTADYLTLQGNNPHDGEYKGESILNRLAKATSKTLYIQMEYCENHTLADLIRQGLYQNSREYWRLLREILDALAYIHSEGVIHRDLKPKNIFIDQARNIKIGDFGLARSVVKQLQSHQNISGDMSSMSQDGTAAMRKSLNNVDNEDLTTDVGTSLYAAVEVTRVNKGGYNEKVDIFSLGIIFFEMVCGFDTEMERINSIRNARRPQIELPSKLTDSKEMETELDLLRSMLNHDPEKRPSASGMLHSGKIPVEDREMTIKEAISNIRDARVVQQLTDELFSRPRLSAQEVLYDRINATAAFNRRTSHHQLRISKGAEYLTMSYVQDTLRTVFRTHGAVDNTALRPRLFPRSPLYKLPTVVEILSRQGIVLQMPHDLTLPHARRLAEIVPDYSKAFAIDSVYRNRIQNPGQHPSRHIEVDFDIISVNSSEESVIFDDAEAIAVMYDSANTVLNPAFNPKETNHDLIVVISHQDILSATLSQCGLIPPQYYAAISLLIGGSIEHRGPALARSNISTASLDMLSNFGFRENLAQAEGRMSRLMPLSDRVKRGINHIQSVAETFLKLCATQNAPTIYFSPLIHTATAEFYSSGIIFQLIDTKSLGIANARKFGSGSVLAVGGRYDSLIKTFRNSVLDGRTPLAGAVGFGMSADKLELMVSKYQQHQTLSNSVSVHASNFVPSRCQVLVSSLSEESVKMHGIDVVKLLWAYGVNADIIREPISTEGIIALAQREGIPIVVIIKQGHALHNVNKAIKPLRAKKLSVNGSQSQGDTDLTFNELIPFVKNELGITGLTTSDLDSLVPIGDAPLPPTEVDTIGERIIVINESGKLKGGRKNRWQLEERSCEARGQFLSDLGNAPIVSLDLRDDVLEAITTVSPHATEDWKRRVVGLSPNQKAYIMTVQAKLSTEALRSPRMLLYSSKTENVFVYNY